jgi:energy-coupling factor transport system permease protein
LHPLDRINPFAKLLAALLVSSLGWLAGQALTAGLLAAAVLALLLACRVPHAGGYLRLMALVGTLVALSWTLSLAWGGMPWPQAADEALRMAFRLIATTGSFFIAIETISAATLLAACGKLRLPGLLTLSLVLIIGMIPLLREELQIIGETQRCRGLELDRGALSRRILHALARGVPLMVQTFRMAESIALSLSIYGFDPRTRRSTWREVGWLTVETRFPLPPSALPPGPAP